MPRLTPEQLPDDYARPETPQQDSPGSMLQHALDWAAMGWNVFPLQPGKKEPMRGSKGAHDGTQDEDQIRRWWTQFPTANIGGNLGDDKLVFDIDANHNGVAPRTLPATRTHVTGRGGENKHYIYGIRPGSAAAAVKQRNGWATGIDIKVGHGGYIVLPPSIHPETGRPYAIEPGGEIHEIEDAELQAIFDEVGVAMSATARGAAKGLAAVGGAKKNTKTSGASENAGHLSSLLANPPERGTGQTNEWLTRVAGHYAKMHRDKRDLYEVEVRRAAAMVDPNYEDTEKVLESVWGTEETRIERSATPASGWLVGNGRVMFHLIRVGNGDDAHYDTAPYSDFDVECRGVAVDDSGKRSYWLTFANSHGEVETTIAGEIFGDPRTLRKVLASYGLSYHESNSASPEKMDIAARLLRYIEHQRPPRVEIVPTLGWKIDYDGFITHDGVIKADGPHPHSESGLVADPTLTERDVAPYHYGFDGSWSEAVEVLREVMTFQDEQTCAVFGAWWAAALLKPQIQSQTSLFPIFGVEAASESGKTNGFFRLMTALNGNTRGQVVPTKPVLRDYASANFNGIVWADDLEDLTPYGDILRASTSNGTASKMDVDRHGVKSTQIVAPILISGESLGMSSQKALADRAVVISAPSPVDRKNALGNPQWDDIVALVSRFGGESGLASIAGHFVQHALADASEVLSALAVARREGQGRHGDKTAVLMAGAWLLDSWLGGETVQDRVREWAGLNQRGLQHDNTITMDVLPWAIRTFPRTEQPLLQEMGRYAGIVSPVLVLDGGQPTLEEAGGAEVWISATLLADAWSRDHNHRITTRTESDSALNQQAARITYPGPSKQIRMVGGGRPTRYRQLLPEYARLVLDRAEGE
ncbi:primase [Curtobacterium phage Parvaparticeps]|nr:primase [Curtobacterium phage Parvaparticeps]